MPMVFQLYINTKSWVHKLDPRTKFVLIVTLGSTAGFWNVATHTMPLLLISFAILLSLKVPLRRMLPFLAIYVIVAPVGLIFNMLFFTLWTYQLPLWATPPQFYNVFVTNQGPPPYGQWSAIWVAVGFFSRLIMVWTMCQSDYTDFLEGFKFPYWFAFGVATSFRLLPSVLGSYLQILEAQKARGSTLGGGPMFIFSPKAFRSIRYLLGAASIPLFYCTFKMTVETTLALDSRGIDLSEKALKRRTRYTEPHLSRRDIIVMLVCIIFAVFAWVTGRVFYWGFKQW